MAGSVFLGVVLAIMFLAAFSEWFVHLATGVYELIPSGYQFYSQIVSWLVISAVFMAVVFFILAVVYECPRGEKREGVFALMDCSVYWQIREKWGGLAFDEVSKGVNTLNE